MQNTKPPSLHQAEKVREICNIQNLTIAEETSQPPPQTGFFCLRGGRRYVAVAYELLVCEHHARRPLNPQRKPTRRLLFRRCCIPWTSKQAAVRSNHALTHARSRALGVVGWLHCQAQQAGHKRACLLACFMVRTQKGRSRRAAENRVCFSGQTSFRFCQNIARSRASAAV